jgi:hypothetical protein
MRESIPDDIAHEFLTYLLESFLIGLPTSSAVYYSRPHLRESYDRRHLFPGASMLPILCVASPSGIQLDTPVLQISGIDPIRKEMMALATLSKARLILIDYNDISALKVLESYADQLKNKNRVNIESICEIQLSDISWEYKTEGKLIWVLTLFAKVGADKIIWGQGYVNIKTGHSELLLDNRPSSWIDTSTDVNKFGVNIPRNTNIEINGCFQKLSLTKIAIIKVYQEYKKYTQSIKDFDGTTEVSQFGGWLKDMNKKDFLMRFAIIKSSSHSSLDEEINREAYMNTAFGQARFELGITDIHITLPKERWTTLAKVIENDRWSQKDLDELRSAGVNEDLWNTLNVPNVIIVDKAQRANSDNWEVNIKWNA